MYSNDSDILQLKRRQSEDKLPYLLLANDEEFLL